MESFKTQWTLIDIGKSAIKTSTKIFSNNILACHALLAWSGCDTVAQLSGIGKAAVLKKSKQVHIISIALQALTTLPMNWFNRLQLICQSSVSRSGHPRWGGRQQQVPPNYSQYHKLQSHLTENVKRAYQQTAIWFNRQMVIWPFITRSAYVWLEPRRAHKHPNPSIVTIWKASSTRWNSEDGMLWMCLSSTLRNNKMHLGNAHLPCTIICACKLTDCHSQLSNVSTDDVEQEVPVDSNE